MNMLVYFCEAFGTCIKKKKQYYIKLTFILTSSHHVWEISSQINPHGVKVCGNRWTLHLVLKVSWQECCEFGSKSLSPGPSHKKSFIFISIQVKRMGFSFHCRRSTQLGLQRVLLVMMMMAMMLMLLMKVWRTLYFSGHFHIHSHNWTWQYCRVRNAHAKCFLPGEEKTHNSIWVLEFLTSKEL